MPAALRSTHTVATSQPVSALRAVASENVFVNSRLSWERGGLGNALGLRRVKRCLIAGVSFTFAISSFSTPLEDCGAIADVRMGAGGKNECLRERVCLESHCHSWRSKYSNQRVLPPLGIRLTVDQINVNPNASWCLDFKESSREEFSSAATRIVYRRCGTIHYTEPRET